MSGDADMGKRQQKKHRKSTTCESDKLHAFTKEEQEALENDSFSEIESLLEECDCWRQESLSPTFKL